MAYNRYGLVDIGILRLKCCVSVGYSPLELKALLKRDLEGSPWADGVPDELKYRGCDGLAEVSVMQKEGEEEELCSYIMLKSFRRTVPEDYAILAHEVLHIVQFIMGRIGAKGEQEFEAYTHTALMMNCYGVLLP